jgi:hypothetical protein
MTTKKKWLIFLPAAMAGLSSLSPFIETLKSEDDALLITYSSAISGAERKLVPAVGEAAKEAVVAKRETPAAVLTLEKSAAAPASPRGAIRVLFLGSEAAGSRKHCHTVMRDFGRDALWFDYTADPAQVTPEWIAQFDAVLLDAPAATFPALAGVPQAKVVTTDFTDASSNPAPDDFLIPLKEKLLTAAGPQRRGEWVQFIQARETEKREVKPTVANYERRPQPLTYQYPLSVTGSMERTQAAPQTGHSLKPPTTAAAIRRPASCCPISEKGTVRSMI